MIEKDEKDVQSILSVIIDRFRNLFEFDIDKESSSPETLTNKATGIVATASTCISKKKKILEAKTNGKQSLI